MLILVAFFVLQLAISAFAAWRGGAPERCVAALLLLAGIASSLTPYDPARSYAAVYWDVVWIDLALLVGLVVVALLADRFWPLWLAALHLLAVAIHGVRAYDALLLPYAYWLLAGSIAFPMMAILAVATLRHRRRRRRGLPEFGWTFQRHAHERAREGS